MFYRVKVFSFVSLGLSMFVCLFGVNVGKTTRLFSIVYGLLHARKSYVYYEAICSLKSYRMFAYFSVTNIFRKFPR